MKNQTSDLPKYIVHHDNTEISNRYSEISGDIEMNIWLKDGSLSSGDKVYQISKGFIVQPADPELVLDLKEEHL